MATVYLGTSDFAATVLEPLAATPHRPVLVVTRPDRPKGRGRRLAPPPVAERARELGLELIQPERLHDPEPLERIAAAEPSALVVCAYGVLVREPLLSGYEVLNVHPSLLPRWRGAAPVERAIEAGDEETGATIMRPTAELDAGPIFLQRSEPIRPDDDYGSLAPRLAALGGELLIETLDTAPAARDQPDHGVTYAEKIAPAELERRVRALTPHIGAYVELADGERLGVRRARLAAGVDDVEPGALAARDSALVFGAAQGALRLLEVHPPGRTPMAADAWLRGRGGSTVG
jgi:methionyl-tRNA formyltransferase